MGRFLSTEVSGLVYSLRVFLMHVRDLILVPRYFLMKDSLSTWSGTSFGQGNPCER